MGNAIGYRQDFPPGTPTERVTFMTTSEKADRMRREAAERRMALGKFLEEKALTDRGDMMENTAQELIKTIRELRDEQSATCVVMKDIRHFLRMILDGVNAGVLDGMTPELIEQMQGMVEQMNENIPRLQSTRDLAHDVARSIL